MSLAGGGKRLERIIRCGCAPGTGGEELRIDIDGASYGATLRISQLAERMATALPNKTLDLIEVAAHVYAIDSIVTRGGPTDPHMGARWRRLLRVEMPVRDPDLWNSPEVRFALTETLNFLSDDDWSFEFHRNETPAAADAWFEFGEAGERRIDEVIMFSGGLDSFAGALEELVARNASVALVTHMSSTKLLGAQRGLVDWLKKNTAPDRVLHVPVTHQMKGGAHREGAHRARSFLFAALGMATAQMFGRERIRFYENGVVSMNLPPSGQVIGARATRTTHPKVLAGLSRLFTALFQAERRVDNPFFWKTKVEILDTIVHHGGGSQIRHTRSCADVHNRTRINTHCGRCSQCIDRRFAAIAAGLADADPEEAYEVDLLLGDRVDGRDREMALSYVRQARRFVALSDSEHLARFGEIMDAVPHLGMASGPAAENLITLHRRHGAAVTGVIDSHLSRFHKGEFQDAGRFCLLRLAGSERLGVEALLPVPTDEIEKPPQFVVEIHRRHVNIDILGDLTGVDAEVLSSLATKHLEAAGLGLAPEDHPVVPAWDLADQWGLTGEEAVRRRMTRLRTSLGRLGAMVGIRHMDQDAVVETLPRKGYRLNPDRVRVVSVK